MGSVIQRLSAMIAASIFAVFSVASVAFAQSSGVGGDGYTSLMWKGYDSSIALWRFDPTVSIVVADIDYGPYLGFTPIALTTDFYSNSHVLWRYTDGSISLWNLDPGMNFSSSEDFGPYYGWTAESLSADPMTGGIRLIWKNTNGAVSIWVIDSDGNVDYQEVYGPFSGYEPALKRHATSFKRHVGRLLPFARFSARGKSARKSAAEAMAKRAARVPGEMR